MVGNNLMLVYQLSCRMLSPLFPPSGRACIGSFDILECCVMVNIIGGDEMTYKYLDIRLITTRNINKKRRTSRGKVQI